MKLKNHSGSVFRGRNIMASLFVAGIAITVILAVSGRAVISYTSSDRYCISCHIHPGADQSWKLSTHYNNKSGNIVHCTECHLPPEGHGYLYAKAKHGLKDVYGFLVKDSARINWEKKKLLENAKGFVYEESCIHCHQNLFPVMLSVNGGNAHLFYTTSKDPLNCINCHIDVGHYDPNIAPHTHDTSFGVTVTPVQDLYTGPAKVGKFENFREMIPGTTVSFDMVAIPSGTFNMGSPDKESLRDNDEGPVRKVSVVEILDGKN